MQKHESPKVQADRELLRDAQSRGFWPTLRAFLTLSGPGWLQSAITLGGGSLAGSLFLGVLGGTSLLWLQLVAILMGVVMLSAISYVTLSTGERPFRAINTHINPVLGWGWLLATSMANMIWCMPQFSLCYAALNKNLVPGGLGESLSVKLMVSAVILAAVSVVVALNARRGTAATIFDWFLKALVGMIVLCFFGVVVYLSSRGVLDWGRIFAGFVPDLSQWTNPAGDTVALIESLPTDVQQFWSSRLVVEQRAVMIGAAATAVGINMTFLMPYSMLHRGWDKPVRGLARFDLATGMAIPYVLVTSCVVIASAYAFHAKDPEDGFLSSDPATFEASATFNGAKDTLLARVAPELAPLTFDAAVKEMSADERQQLVGEMARLSEQEKRLASSLVRRDAFTLSSSLAPLLGERFASLVFGLGIFGMGFSTIIILMLINGFVFCEAAGQPERGVLFVAGCLVAGVSGAVWPLVWDGPAKLWLAILASSFGMMLLPIAYVTFFMMMNSNSLLGKEKPRGLSLLVWNVLMFISVVGAIAAAATAIYDKASDPQAGPVVLGVGGVYVVLVIIGFFLKPRNHVSASSP